MELQRPLCLFLVLCTSAAVLIWSSADAYQFTLDWAAPKNSGNNIFNLWAAKNRFQVNDTLSFKYPKGSDTVLEVSKEDYEGCVTAKPIKKMEGGDSLFRFDRSGPFFFISSNATSCSNSNKKLIVQVMAVRHPKKAVSPPPSSPASPAPLAHGPAPTTPSGAVPSASPTTPSVMPPASALSPSPVSPAPANGPAKNQPGYSPGSPPQASVSPVAPYFPSPSLAPALSPSYSPPSPPAYGPVFHSPFYPISPGGPAPSIMPPQTSLSPVSTPPATTPSNGPVSAAPSISPSPATLPPSLMPPEASFSPPSPSPEASTSPSVAEPPISGTSPPAASPVAPSGSPGATPSSAATVAPSGSPGAAPPAQTAATGVLAAPMTVTFLAVSVAIVGSCIWST